MRRVLNTFDGIVGITEAVQKYTLPDFLVTDNDESDVDYSIVLDTDGTYKLCHKSTNTLYNLAHEYRRLNEVLEALLRCRYEIYVKDREDK